MVRKNRMKSFRSRVSDHEADGAKTWSRWYSYQLKSGSQIKVDSAAEKIYGSKSYAHLILARTLLSGLRKNLEKKTGQMLVCRHGVYSLLDHKEKGKIYGVNSGLEAESLERIGRSTRVANRFNSYRRSVEISIKHNPRMLKQARTEVSVLGSMIKKAERDIFNKALRIVSRNAKHQGGKKP